MARFRLTSLRFRLLILVLLAVVPALALTIRSADELRRAATTQGQAEALRLARLAAGDLNLLVEGTRQLLVVLAQLPAVQGRESAACGALLADLLKAYPLYANLGLVGPDGREVCSAVPVDSPVGASDRTWFKQAVLTRHFVVGDCQMGRVTGKLTITFGHPIIGEDDQPTGVLFAAWDLGWLNDLVAKAKIPPDSTLTVMDRDGTILARYPHAGSWTWPSPQEQAVIAAARTAAEGTVEFTGLDGVTRLNAFKKLEATPAGDLRVSISIPTPVAFAGVGHSLTSSLASLGLVMILALAAAWLGGNVFILHPVRALLGATRQLQAGDLSARTDLRYGAGELGQLARAFDEMAADLEQRTDQLRSVLAKSIHIQDEERARLARDMHDGVLQLITAARYELKAAKLAAESGSPVIAQNKFTSTRQVLDEIEKEIRQAIYDLHPSILDGRGLVPSLRRFVNGFRELSGVSCQVQVKGTAERLSAPTELGIFRMVAEALQNVAVHAEARAAFVTLDYRDRMLRVTVRDNGKGFDLEEVPALHSAEHLGLISIRERSESLGGGMEVRSEPGQGTSVTFWLPLLAENASGDLPCLPR